MSPEIEEAMVFQEEPGQRGRLWQLAALLVAALGVALRCLPWREVIGASSVTFLGVDPYYHLRRAWMIVESFPDLQSFDRFIAFPWGASIFWPPGFDLLIALPGLLGLPWAGVELWAALLPPLLGGCAVYLTFWLGRQLLGPGGGLAAAALTALMYGSVHAGLIGRTDHHALVAPLTLAMLGALLKCLRAPTDAAAKRWGVACGGLAGLAVGGWIVTPPLYFSVVPAVLIGLRFTRHAAAARRAIPWCLGSALVASLAVILVVADLERKPFDLYQPSLFILLPYGAAAVVGIAVLLRMRAALLLLVGTAGLAAAAAALWPGLGAPLREAWVVTLKREPTYRTILESRSPLFTEDWFNLESITGDFSYLILLVPALWAGLIWRAWRGREDLPATLLLLIYATLGTALLLLQKRFGEFAAPALALLFGWGLLRVLELVQALARGTSSRARVAAWSTLLAVSLGLALSPLVTTAVELSRTSFTSHQRALLAFAGDFAARTPAAAGPDGAPGYGVLTGWVDAQPLLYATGRAVTVTPFGTVECVRATRLGFRLLLGTNEEAIVRSMEAHRLRYVVVSPIVGQLRSMAEIAGLPSAAFERISADGRGMLTFVRGPATLAALAPLSHFRLVSETPETTTLFGRRTPLIKAFERVAGARFAGVAAPGTTLRLELPLRSNTGRALSYVRETTAGADGRFEILVPYSTEPSTPGARALGPYQIRIGEAAVEVSVTEAEVRDGRRVDIPSLPGPAELDHVPDSADSGQGTSDAEGRTGAMEGGGTR